MGRLTTIREPVDITGAELLEIVIRRDGKVIWLNDAKGCLVRICRIKGHITIRDDRQYKKVGRSTMIVGNKELRIPVRSKKLK